MAYCVRALLGVFALGLMMNPAMAHGQSTPMPRGGASAGSTGSHASDASGIRGLWVSGGGGSASGAGSVELADAIGLHAQRGEIVISARRNSVSLNRTPVEAIGVVAGRAMTSRRALFAALSAGPSYVRQTGYFDRQLGVTRSAVGLMVAGDVSLRSGNAGGVGIGLTTYGHANSVQSLFGVALEIFAGKWR